MADGSSPASAEGRGLEIVTFGCRLNACESQAISERAAEDAITQISAAAYSFFDRVGRASDLGRVISPDNGGRR